VAEPAVAALAEQLLQRTSALQQPAERWLQAARSDWDLAQFDFSRSGRARAFKRLGTLWSDLLSAPQWRPARWGAVLLLLVNLVGLNAFAWRERSTEEAKREALRHTLTQTFPQVKVVVDAPVQMEREVAALRRSTGAPSGADLEAMLAALAAAVPPQHAATGLDYSNGELRVRGLSPTDEELRQVASTLHAQGYSATKRGDALVITLEGQP
jgi:general secretion pathway protein L